VLGDVTAGCTPEPGSNEGAAVDQRARPAHGRAGPSAADHGAPNRRPRRTQPARTDQPHPDASGGRPTL